MFGYVKPYKPELRVKEYELYKGVYCALCKQLGKEYGLFSRFMLNYDCAFLALMGMGLHGECAGMQKGRCCCNPLKRCAYASATGESLSYAAAMTILLTYHKLRDDVADDGPFRSLGARLLLLFIGRKQKKAAARYPEQAETLANEMAKQAALEQVDSFSMDACAEPTAKMLATLSGGLSEEPGQRRVLRTMGYYLGRWVYLIDAADDMKKDLAAGRFNPFIRKMDLTPEADEETLDGARQYANEALNVCVSQAIVAFNLLEIKQMKPVIENVLEWGLAQTQRLILFEKEGKHDKRSL